MNPGQSCYLHLENVFKKNWNGMEFILKMAKSEDMAHQDRCPPVAYTLPVASAKLPDFDIQLSCVLVS